METQQREEKYEKLEELGVKRGKWKQKERK